MLYEIGIYYPSKEHDAQVKLTNIPITANRRRFWFNGRPIPHWDEDDTTWVKVPVLNGMTKIYVDDSANKDLSSIDETMIFGDDFTGDSLDTNKWIISVDGQTTNVSNSILSMLPPSGTTHCGIHSISTPITNNTKVEVKIAEVASNLETSYGPISFVDVPWVGATSTYYQFVGQWQTQSASQYGYRYNDGTNHQYGIGTRPSSPNVLSAYIVNNQIYVKDSAGQSGGPFPLNPKFSLPYQIALYREDKIDYIFVHKYLPQDPIIKYIQPTRNWWLFQEIGGIIKKFFAGVLESDTQANDIQASTVEASTNEKEGIANFEESLTNVGTQKAGTLENITNVLTSITSSAEKLTQNISQAHSSIEAIINAYSFKGSAVENIANPSTSIVGSQEDITQVLSVSLGVLEEIVHQYQYMASTLESTSNIKDGAAGSVEAIYSQAVTTVSSLEKLINEYNFYTSTIERIISTGQSSTGSLEQTVNTVSNKAGSEESIIYAYQFITGVSEELIKTFKHIASVSEGVANGSISITNALEEIADYIATTIPFYAKTIKEVKRLQADIKERW